MDARRVDLPASRRTHGPTVERWLPYDEMVAALVHVLFVERSDVGTANTTRDEREAIARSTIRGYRRLMYSPPHSPRLRTAGTMRPCPPV